MIRADAVVVGGGPAGSTLARALVDRGLDVVVLDRSRFPRDKVCAGWITPAVVAELALDLGDYARGRVLQPIHGFRVGGMGGTELGTTVHDDPVSYGIRRCEFDHYLLERSGARLVLGRPLERLTRHDGTWTIDGEIRTPLVVGAGGHFCPVARALGFDPGEAAPVVAAQEIEFELDGAAREACPVLPSVPELYFCEDLRGYGWIFRKGDWINVGLGREDRHGLSRHVAAFARSLAARGKIPEDLPARFRGHAYRLYPRGPREVTADGALLVGDAAGLAYAESGEGIRPAIESALLAADAIAAAGGDYRRERLAPYRERLTRRFGGRERTPGLGSLLPRAALEALGRRLLRTRWFAEHVVIDRWFLHAGTPALQSDVAPARNLTST
jgi:geranylgeranyl reductase family protein